MSITVIKGGISSGKTTLCMDMIEKLHKTNKCIMLVNDKYSFEAEKSFIKRFGGTGLNNIEVMTFRKLADQFVNSENMLYMTDAGKHMLVQRAIREYIESEPEVSTNMLRTMQKDGFIEVMSSFLSEMGNYRTTSEQIRNAMENCTDKIFVEKMKVIADISDIYNKMTEGMNYIDSNRFLDILSQKINAGTDFFDDAYVFVDCFNDFLLPRWNVIKAINSRAKQVYITLCVSGREEEKEFYHINQSTLDMIKEEYTIDEIDAMEHLQHTHTKNPELYHLISTWNDESVFEEEPKNIRMFKSLDMYMEIERVACKIVDLVREEGYRYRDIAVVCSDDEVYAPLVEPVFNEYEIPYFSDRKQLLYNHPIAVQITSLFDMFENRFDYESVFSFLKAGFIFRAEKSKKGKIYTPIAQEEIDELENYVLKYGIRGKKRWLGEEDFARELTLMQAAFDDGKDSAFYQANEKQIEKINNLRDELMSSVAAFDKKLRKLRTGKSYAKALFEFLEDINMPEGIEAEIVHLEDADRIDESQQFERIWELILEVLEQLIVTMGDEEMSLEEFSEYIKSGISTCEIRLVPSGIDRVYFGGADSSVVVGAKVLFAMGATEGTYPNNISSQGFLSDKERTELNESGKRKMLAETTTEQMLRKNYAIFDLFAHAKDYIFVSMYSYDSSGAEKTASSIINKIKKKFPKVIMSNNFSHKNSEERFYISTPNATLHKMLINKSLKRADKNPLWEAVRKYYENNPRYEKKLHLLEEESEFFKSLDYIDEGYARALYGDSIVYSNSKINEYGMCPYRFFLNYGLGIKEREEWEISKADLGSYAHEVIEKFCKIVEEGASTPEEKLAAWKSLDKETRWEILQGIFNSVRERINSSQINEQEKVTHILGRMNKVITKATDVISNCFVHGKYTIKSMEQEFTVALNEEVSINGFVDRIDELNKNGENLMRIIDYKTGSAGFDIREIYDGVNMQMPLYALAAKLYYLSEEQKDYSISGMYYTKLRGELKKDEKEVRELKQLNGVTFGDNATEVLSEMDDSINNRESVLFSLNFKNDGTLYKSSLDKVRTSVEGKKLLEFVGDKILEFDENIRKKGDIRILPYEKACKYCDYARLCSVCDEIPKREKSGLKAEEVWEKISNYGEEAEDER